MKLQNVVAQFGSCSVDASDPTWTDLVRSVWKDPDERCCGPQLGLGDHRELGRNRESVCQQIDEPAR